MTIPPFIVKLGRLSFNVGRVLIQWFELKSFKSMVKPTEVLEKGDLIIAMNMEILEIKQTIAPIKN